MPLEYLLSLGLLWSLALLIASLRGYGSTCPPHLTKWQVISLIFTIALLARLVPSILIPIGAGHDITSYSIVAELLNSGKDVYSAPEAVNRHPYLPFQMYWMLISYKWSLLTGLSFVKIVRLLPILADATIAVIVFEIILDTDKDLNHAWQGGLLYALNPITIFVVAYHGQFDTIPILLILTSWMFWYKWPHWNLYLRITLSASCLGLAILSKSWPILFLPIMMIVVPKLRNKLIYIAITAFIPLSAIVIYAILFNANFMDIVTPTITYNHGIGIWGYSYLVRLGTHLGILRLEIFEWVLIIGRWITLGLIGITFWFYARKWDAMGGLLLLLLGFLTFGHAFSIQYLAWIIPFAIIVNHRLQLKRFLLAASAYMILAYFTLILLFRIDELFEWSFADLALVIPLGIPAWLIILHWFFKGCTEDYQGSIPTIRIQTFK
ncbi:MAG: hypothetical protein GTO18_17235 [Anaerolineales bacterium]|nr:hypothetical protein [Anaerolineales bacterium]